MAEIIFGLTCGYKYIPVCIKIESNYREENGARCTNNLVNILIIVGTFMVIVVSLFAYAIVIVSILS